MCKRTLCYTLLYIHVEKGMCEDKDGLEPRDAGDMRDSLQKETSIYKQYYQVEN